MASNNLGYQGFVSINDKLNHVLKPIFRKKRDNFLVIDSLNKNWQKIVGEKCHSFCFPKQVKFEKNKKNDSLLVISADNAAIAFYLESNLNQITQNIASLFGYKIVGKIRIIINPKITQTPKEQSENLDEKTLNLITNTTSQIEDLELKHTLVKLGKSILKHKS